MCCRINGIYTVWCNAAIILMNVILIYTQRISICNLLTRAILITDDTRACPSAIPKFLRISKQAKAKGHFEEILKSTFPSFKTLP